MAADRERIPLGAPQPHKLGQLEVAQTGEPEMDEPVEQDPAPAVSGSPNKVEERVAPARAPKSKKPPRRAPAQAVIPSLGLPALRILSDQMGRYASKLA